VSAGAASLSARGPSAARTPRSAACGAHHR
jgi:hypothetical protein